MHRKRKFTKMYDTYADDIFRFLFVNVRDRDLAEDLTADTFMRAWKAIDSFDFSQPRPWLYKIAQNLMHDHWRKRHTEQFPDNFEVVSDFNLEEGLDRQFTQDRVHNAVARLPEPMKSVVILRFISGYSARQTAQSLKLSESNIRVIQCRALKRLKGIL